MTNCVNFLIRSIKNEQIIMKNKIMMNYNNHSIKACGNHEIGIVRNETAGTCKSLTIGCINRPLMMKDAELKPWWTLLTRFKNIFHLSSHPFEFVILVISILQPNLWCFHSSKILKWYYIVKSTNFSVFTKICKTNLKVHTF